MLALFFSCTNDIAEVRDFLADKNLPIGVSKNIYTVYKDSGRINSIIKSPLFLDFSNRNNHPYSEFPEGIQIMRYGHANDSTKITGNYAIRYTRTKIAEIRGNVVITNYKKHFILRTSQLFWDQNTHYFVTEKKFSLITPTDSIYGTGFESRENLTDWQSKNISGSLQVKE